MLSIQSVVEKSSLTFPFLLCNAGDVQSGLGGLLQVDIWRTFLGGLLGRYQLGRTLGCVQSQGRSC